jgi:hypothetical protein
MLEANGKAVTKNMQVYEWPKRFREDHANVSDDP